MDQVGLWINRSKPEAINFAEQIAHWFVERGWEVATDWEKIKAQGANFLISLGGDGTLLEASREAASYGIPVLGVNLGRLGFLCEIERNEVFDALEKVIAHDYTIQERLMLAVTVADSKDTYFVLNDVVFLREPSSAMVTLQAKLSGEPSVSYPADGLIISTPTGSTAYALSAGGPIMSPNVEAILLTPLAAHSLSSRPMVISDKEDIEIFIARGKECMVNFDGYLSVNIKYGERVHIKRAPINALLIRLGKRSFPRVVREKLQDRWHA